MGAWTSEMKLGEEGVNTQVNPIQGGEGSGQHVATSTWHFILLYLFIYLNHYIYVTVIVIVIVIVVVYCYSLVVACH